MREGEVERWLEAGAVCGEPFDDSLVVRGEFAAHRVLSAAACAAIGLLPTSSRTRGMTWVPYSSIVLMTWLWVRPGMPNLRSKRLASSSSRLATILLATVSGEPT